MALRVLGIGDNVADHYVHINTIYPGGCAFNFAAFASMLGADAAYLGAISDDFAGRHNLKTAVEMGVDTKRCRILHGETPLPTVRIEAGERIFIGMNEHGVWERPVILRDKDLEYIKTFNLLHTSIYSGMEQNLEILAETGVPISMDFSATYSDMFVAAHCPHLTYAIMSCGHISTEKMLEQIKKAHEFGAPNVIATRGAEGAWFSDGTEIYHRPAKMIEAIDTMGAGDSFLTAFLLNYEGWKLREGNNATRPMYASAAESALDAASHFSAKVCTMEGAFGHGIIYKPDVIID
jgi:sugar/nucleoside kinase (ribokinase family)